MKKIKILNLYACLGGNRYKWNVQYIKTLMPLTWFNSTGFCVEVFLKAAKIKDIKIKIFIFILQI